MRYLKTTGKIAGSALIIASGLLIVGYMVAQTQMSNNFIASTVNRITSQMDTRIIIDGIHGKIFSDARVKSIQISDANGVWLEVHNLNIVWNPIAWFIHDTVFEKLTADSVMLSRLPVVVNTDQKPETKTKSSLSFKQIKSLLSGHISVGEISVSEAVTRGQAQTLNLSAQAAGHYYNIDLHTLQGALTTLQSQIILNEQNPGLNLHLEEEPQGVLSGLLQLPSESKLYVDVKLLTDQSHIIDLDHAIITAGTSHLYATGQYSPATTSVTGKVTMTMPDISILQQATQTSLAGALNAYVTVQGPLDKMAVTLKAYTPGMVVADNQIADLAVVTQAVIDTRARHLNELTGQANILAKTSLNDHAVYLDGQVKAEQGKIDVNIQKAAYAPYALSGQGQVNVNQQEFAINIATDKTGLRNLIPQTTLDGTATATLEAKGHFTKFDSFVKVLIDTNHGQSNLDFKGQIDRSEKTLEGDLTGRFIHDKRVFDVQTKIASDPAFVKINQTLLKGPGIDVAGQGVWDIEQKLADGNLDLNADDLKPLGELLGLNLVGSFQAKAAATHEDKRQKANIDLQKLNVTASGQSVTLRSPSSLKIDQDIFSLSPLSVSFGGGVINAQGDMSPDHVKAQLNARGLMLKNFVPALSEGKTDININLTGTPKAPIAIMSAKGFVRTSDLPLQFNVTGDWRGSVLKVQANGTSNKATLQAQAQLISTLSLWPFKTDISPQTAMTGSIKTYMPLSTFNPFLWPAGHRVGGTLDGQGTVKGRLGDPQLNGLFSIKNADYTHVDTGVCLHKLNATIRATNDQITLQGLQATDQKGRMLKGKMQLALKGDQRFNGAVDLQHFQMFCGGLATGDVDGVLNASGTLKNMLLAGKLTLGPLNVQLPGAQTESAIPTVETIRKRSGNTIAAKSPASLRLDIALDAPNQIFVRGRGLDAEFGGKLNIMGYASKPAVTGLFASRRGNFTLLDRVLKLQTAELRFEGTIPPSPFLNINAETKVKATTLTVDLAGPAVKPKLTLSSVPGLPQDEILALLLFGRQLQTISPFEAIKLAQATRTLAGLDGGEPGILDKARATLGLDVLNIGTSDNNDMTVSTGKYVTDKVFVGVQQGSKPEDKQVKTEIELTPSVSANTTIDGNANQGVGIGWRHDY